MKRKNRALLALERMEDRLVPATVRLIGGTLLISNPTIQAGKTALTVTQTANNTFTVVDGSATLGTYSAAGNVMIFGSNAADSITFNTDSFTYAGSLFISGGNGNDTIVVTGGHGASTTAPPSNSGAILGNVNILHNFGNASVGLNTLGAGSLTVGGTTTVTTNFGTDSIQLGSDSTPAAMGNAVTNFLGDVNLSGYSTVIMGTGAQPDTYGGNFNLNEGVNSGLASRFVEGFNPNSANPNQADGTATITLAGNLNVTAGSGIAPDGAGTIGDQLGLSALVVGGNVNVNFGATGASVGNSFGISAFLVTTIQGNLNYSNGGGNNIADLAQGVVFGNTNLQMGTGSDSVALDDAGNTALPTTLEGNLTVTAGNGDLNLAPFAPVQAQIGGNFQVYAQNANITLPIDTSFATIGGVLGVNTGNGTDTFSFNNSAASLGATFDLNYRLGNGVNGFSNYDPAVELTGFIIAGSNPGNTFSNAGTIQSPFELAGFP